MKFHTKIKMKKLWLLGFGIILAGTAMAVTIAPATFTEKFSQDKVSHNEFNLITTTVSALSDAFSGVVADASMITFTKSLTSPTLCIGADCRTGWAWTNSGANIQRTSGNVGIGGAAGTEKLQVTGNILASAFLYSSDMRLKENVKPISSALKKVEALEGISFDWIDSGETSLGFIAQDVEKVLPELVKSSNDEEAMKSVAYGNITALLVEAIKEQQKEIINLREEIEALKK